MTEATGTVEIPPSLSVPTMIALAVLLPLVVPRLKHGVSMQTTPELTASTGGSKLDDSHLKMIDYEVSTRSAINNYDEDTRIDSVQVRSTAYRAHLRETESDTGVSLDNFPECRWIISLSADM